MGIEGILEKGFVTTTADQLINWTRTGSLPGAHDFVISSVEAQHMTQEVL